MIIRKGLSSSFRNQLLKHNIDWFEKDLKWLFKHGVHEFYTYPDEVSGNEEENDSNTQETEDLVQMVETDAKK